MAADKQEDEDGTPLWWIAMASGSTLVSAYAIYFVFMDSSRLPEPPSHFLEKDFLKKMMDSFASRPVSLKLHAGASAVALTAGAVQMHPGIRKNQPWLHRACGYLYASAAYVGQAAAAYAGVWSAAGLLTSIPFGLLNLITTGTTVRAMYLAVNRRYAEHRPWAVRSYSAMYSAVNLRLLMPVLMPTLGIRRGYIAVAWLCWAPHLAVTEYLLYKQRNAVRDETKSA